MCDWCRQPHYLPGVGKPVFSVPGKWVTYVEKGEGLYVEAEVQPEIYDPSEQDVVIETFAAMLRAATKDGGKKRAAGTKPPWWRDGGHRKAFWSHIYKYEGLGERHDKDSGAHPYIHAAWRLLAMAYQETHGQVDPAEQK
jgi:hypothetical protein